MEAVVQINGKPVKVNVQKPEDAAIIKNMLENPVILGTCSC
ncbi:MAG TPA: hypothetical protein VK452_07180 [Dissulfurispiraceae bacterium]|nr:hypothetical protein [Dissulfurispiraceae bacterium]